MGEKEKNMVVNPYGVEGEVNYDKLVKEFGLERINEDILKRIKDKANRKEIMDHMVDQFKREGVKFDKQDFLNKVKLEKGGTVTKLENGVLVKYKNGKKL